MVPLILWDVLTELRNSDNKPDNTQVTIIQQHMQLQ